MARSSGRSSPSRSSPSRAPAAAPRPAARAPAPAAPQAAHPPAPAQSSGGGGMMAGMAGTMMQGMAFGAGSEVAHQAVKAVMGGGSSHSNAPAQQQ